eukprot:6210170-Pleurochrysis_carterae.AAC.1
MLKHGSWRPEAKRAAHAPAMVALVEAKQRVHERLILLQPKFDEERAMRAEYSAGADAEDDMLKHVGACIREEQGAVEMEEAILAETERQVRLFLAACAPGLERAWACASELHACKCAYARTCVRTCVRASTFAFAWHARAWACARVRAHVRACACSCRRTHARAQTYSLALLSSDRSVA